ncbi:MAG: hypothetical protein KDC43_00255 [Saprospiraceae bacterium]|nr:hypothetical protein [Saprospiraceae bacterium]MCB0622372.1 hypothetical protein [Saprospiraceae bacterium]MCB0677856.1 hypothetical protein [Saprospiraceae bacterium]MCB0682483.1 hypothetical protein [Saprospiraceae bacterium]
MQRTILPLIGLCLLLNASSGCQNAGDGEDHYQWIDIVDRLSWGIDLPEGWTPMSDDDLQRLRDNEAKRVAALPGPDETKAWRPVYGLTKDGSTLLVVAKKKNELEQQDYPAALEKRFGDTERYFSELVTLSKRGALSFGGQDFDYLRLTAYRESYQGEPVMWFHYYQRGKGPDLVGITVAARSKPDEDTLLKLLSESTFRVRQ